MTDSPDMTAAITLPARGRVLVAASRALPETRQVLARLRENQPPDGAEIIDAGLVGEWQHGDDDGPPPGLAVLLLHEGCPPAHGHRLAEALMQASAAGRLETVLLRGVDHKD